MFGGDFRFLYWGALNVHIFFGLLLVTCSVYPCAVVLCCRTCPPFGLILCVNSLVWTVAYARCAADLEMLGDDSPGEDAKAASRSFAESPFSTPAMIANIMVMVLVYWFMLYSMGEKTYTAIYNRVDGMEDMLARVAAVAQEARR